MLLKYLLFVLVFLVLVCESGFALEATYYSEQFEGGHTANGDIFSQNIHSLAACEVPLGQYGYVARGGTGIVVTINDRPNCVKYPNLVDLSRTVFELFAPTRVGSINDMSLTNVGKNTDTFAKKNLPKDIFAPLGVELTADISNTYFTRDSILVRGRVLDGKADAMIYLENKKTKKEYSHLVKSDASGFFQLPITLPDMAGVYYYIIASGNSFSTNSPIEIKLIDPNDLQYPTLPKYTGSVTHPKLNSTLSTPLIQLDAAIWAQFTLQQGSQVYESHGSAPNFEGNNLAIGNAKVKISGYTLSTPSSLDRSQTISNLYSGTLFLDRTHESIGGQNVNIRKRGNFVIFRFRLKNTDTKVQDNYYITFPDGSIEEYHFPKKYIGEDGFLVSDVWIQANFATNTLGTYKLETVLQNGYAYFNLPITHGSVWNIISPLTQKEISTIRSDATLVSSKTIDRINSLRKSLGKGVLQESSTLQKLATAKAKNMAQYDYIGHWTPEGLDILDFANSIGINIEGSIGENVAGGNVSDRSLQDGLEESGSHRHNMLDNGWKYIGIGYLVKGGKTYMTELFGN